MKSISVAIENCIMLKDCAASASSKILEGFKSSFDSSAVERLKNAGINISGAIRMTEFGFPGLVKSKNKSTSCGVLDAANNGIHGDAQGELSNAAQAILNGDADYCLCNDLFGRYRKEAAENGLCYIHPTYGTVPRYGLVPLASSMDQIGVLCRDLSGGFKVLSIIAGHDARDGAMFSDEKYSYTDDNSEEIYMGGGREISIRVPSNVIGLADADAGAAVQDFQSKFSSNANQEPLEYFEVYKQALYILACAEISNNISRYDGVKFGYRSPNADDLERMYLNTRTEALGADAKLTAIMGAMVLSDGKYLPYYDKAMRIRRLIKESVSFDGYDVIAMPASIDGGTGADGSFSYENLLYENLSLYALPALAGLPSVTFSYKGRGIQLITNVKNEAALLSAYEEVL